MNMTKLHALLLLTALTLNLIAPVQAAGYLKIGDIKGESTQTHADQDTCTRARAQEAGADKPAPVTYGPVITIKPKGMHQQQNKAAQPAGTKADPKASRGKCFTNH